MKGDCHYFKLVDKPSGKYNIKKLKLSPLDDRSFSKVFNDSFWIVGQGTIVINALDKEYNFGSQISKEDGAKIIKVLNSKINKIKSAS